MKDWDPTGKRGPKMPLPDVVKVRRLACKGVVGRVVHSLSHQVIEPKEDEYAPVTQEKGMHKEGLEL